MQSLVENAISQNRGLSLFITQDEEKPHKNFWRQWWKLRKNGKAQRKNRLWRNQDCSNLGEPGRFFLKFSLSFGWDSLEQVEGFYESLFHICIVSDELGEIGLPGIEQNPRWSPSCCFIREICQIPCEKSTQNLLQWHAFASVQSINEGFNHWVSFRPRLLAPVQSVERNTPGPDIVATRFCFRVSLCAFGWWENVGKESENCCRQFVIGLSITWKARNITFFSFHCFSWQPKRRVVDFQLLFPFCCLKSSLVTIFFPWMQLGKVGVSKKNREEETRPANMPLVKVTALQAQLSPDIMIQRCNSKNRGSVYSPVFGICCHFCRFCYTSNTLFFDFWMSDLNVGSDLNLMHM